MALRRMMREQFAAAEPSAQAWQKLHNRIIATAPIDARQEVQPRVINNPLAWVNLFVPRVMQVAFAVVFMLATVLNSGANVGGFGPHYSQNNGNSTSVVLDDRTVDPPVKNDPNLNSQLANSVAEREASGSNKTYRAEHVRPQTYSLLIDSSPRSGQRVSDDYMLQ